MDVLVKRLNVPVTAEQLELAVQALVAEGVAPNKRNLSARLNIWAQEGLERAAQVSKLDREPRYIDPPFMEDMYGRGPQS